MKDLNYKTLEEMNYNGYLLEHAEEKVLQFGEGNFLRAFVDYFIDNLNEKAGFNGKVAIVQPIAHGLTTLINKQQGLYTLYLRGSENGEKMNKKRIISSVSRCINPYEEYAEFLKTAHNPALRFIVSNTTEAGIVYDKDTQFNQEPPVSYPGKLTRLMFERFSAKLPGFVVLSCELIANNGKELEKCVLRHAEEWNLGDDFVNWIKKENIFCSTLVDRIVTGYPRNEVDVINQENGYVDNLVDTGEIFGFWVIEAPDSVGKELGLDKCKLPIITVADQSPYKMRKVRILNGAHTSFVMAAYLSGQNIVRDCMHDEVIRSYMEKVIYSEVIPTIPLPEKELKDFASSVVDRFNNPFIDHQLLAICLNSTSKWKARVMPSLFDFVKANKRLPSAITFSFAAYLSFYRKGERMDGDALIARRGEEEYSIKDDQAVLDFFLAHHTDSNEELVRAILDDTDFFGEELKNLAGFREAVLRNLNLIDDKGMYETMRTLL